LNRKTLIQFFQLIKEYHKYIFRSVVSNFIVVLVAVPIPWFTKIFLDEIYPTKNYSLLVTIVLVILSFNIFSIVIDIMKSFFTRGFTLELSYDMRFKFYRKIQRLPFKFFDKRETGEILSRNVDLDQSISGITGIIGTVFQNSWQLLIFPILLLLLNWKLALISMFVLPFDLVLYHYSTKKLKMLAKKNAEQGAEINAKTYESLIGIKTIQTLGLEDKIFYRLKRKHKDLVDLGIKTDLLQKGVSFFLVFLSTIGKALYTYVGWNTVLNGELTIGEFIAFSSYTGYLYTPIKELVNVSQRLQVILVHIERFFEYYFYPVPNEIKNNLEIKDGSIDFENVSFGYNDHKVIENLNLKIFPGEKIVITGKNGSGKSSLVNLIGKFYDVNSGIIRIDGHKINEINTNYLRQSISYLFQDPFLFNASIYDNITCFGLYPSKSRLEEVIKATKLEEIFNSQGRSLDYIVGEGGTQLSIGQKQRICVARVLQKDTPIIILDEPTSSIDAETEEIIFDSLERLAKTRTIVFITHNDDLVSKADRVYKMENQQIYEIHKDELIIEYGSNL